MATPYRVIGTNKTGHALGIYRAGAKLTEGDIELIHQLHEGDPENGIKPMGYGKIAEKFDVSKSTIKRVIKGITYAQGPVRWRKVSPR